jgi:hypothetical protein
LPEIIKLMLMAHLIQQLLTRGRLGTVFKAAFHTFLRYDRNSSKHSNANRYPSIYNRPVRSA